MSFIKIYTDGGARGNPGPAAGGILIFDENDKLIKINAKYFGKMTNNQAEYEALLTAFRMIQVMDVKNAKCYLDSDLIVKQLTGIYKVKNPIIKRLKATLDKLAVQLGKVEYFHIRREENKFADKLVNIVLDAKEQRTANR
ncbi:ribonuclease HI family protein [Candidatus Dojkabacteria bacterium]|nr:ribonuclease HI family protein [Candidatus Dojkabacteria bacterium]